MWRRYNMDEIAPEAIDIGRYGKRFKGQVVPIYELIDDDHYIITKFFENLKRPLERINKVIKDVEYPLDALGMPTDYHYFQAFRNWLWSCKKTFRNELDFWQFASETAWLKMGDCEDSSILTAAGLEPLQKALLCSYFVALGRVWKDGQLLGGHAWVIVRIGEHWRLAETTLDTPYKSVDEMPIIDIGSNVWRVGKHGVTLEYEALVLFNKDELWEWEDMESEEELAKLKIYLSMPRKHKEHRRKYIEMGRVWYAVYGKTLKALPKR